MGIIRRAAIVTSFLFLLGIPSGASAEVGEPIGSDSIPLLGAVRGGSGVSGPTGLDQSFLLLPALDVERQQTTQAGKDGPVRVGDPIHLKIDGIPAPTGVAAAGATAKATPISHERVILDLPPGEDKLLDQGWVIEAEESGAIPGDAMARIGKYWFKAIPLKQGSLKLPSLAVKIKDGPTVARTNPFSLEVATAIRPDDKKAAEAADFRPPIGLGFPTAMVIALGILGALVLCAVFYGLYRLIRKVLKRSAKSMAVGPPKSEDEQAMEAFTELEKQGRLARGEFKFHYFRVSEILKTYIGVRFQFDALESTTRELIDILEAPDTRGNREAVRPEIVDRLEILFQKLDRVKFTDHIPGMDEAEKAIPAAREFVSATRKMPTIIPASGVAKNAGAVKKEGETSALR